jgi:hypothetical protein
MRAVPKRELIGFLQKTRNWSACPKAVRDSTYWDCCCQDGHKTKAEPHRNYSLQLIVHPHTFANYNKRITPIKVLTTGETRGGEDRGSPCTFCSDFLYT